MKDKHILIILLVASALIASVPITSRMRALDLFDQGVKHYQEGQWQSASQSFQRSQELVIDHKSQFYLTLIKQKQRSDCTNQQKEWESYLKQCERGDFTYCGEAWTRQAQRFLDQQKQSCRLSLSLLSSPSASTLQLKTHTSGSLYVIGYREDNQDALSFYTASHVNMNQEVTIDLNEALENLKRFNQELGVWDLRMIFTSKPQPQLNALPNLLKQYDYNLIKLRQHNREHYKAWMRWYEKSAQKLKRRSDKMKQGTHEELILQTSLRLRKKKAWKKRP